MAEFVLGIDGGGTKLAAVLENLQTGEQFSLSTDGGINSIIDDPEDSRRHLRSMIEDIVILLSAKEGTLSGICIGSASVMTDYEKDHWCEELLSQSFPGVPIGAVTDSRIALEGALRGEPGAIVIAGTGSISLSKDSLGQMKRCGGWGSLFGDEGSGYWIGCESLRAVAKHWDGRGDATLLTDRLLEKLQVSTFEGIIQKVYGEMDRKEVASLSVITGECAADRDPAAMQIVEEAGVHLACLASTILEQTVWESKPLLSYAGGVFRMGEQMKRSFLSHLGPWNSVLTEPHEQPAYGAVLLALRMKEAARY
jgi:N-acetylglucosamine kinase-like BadF-type ATPase